MTEQGEIIIDVFQKLSNNRILFISGDIDDNIGSDISATLLLKDAENCDEKITIFINSQGGDIRNALAIYDIINMISSPIETVCIGTAVRESLIILMAGTPGMRFATKHSIICVEQLINDSMQLADLTEAKTILNQSLYDNKKMMEIIAKCTGKTYKQVLIDFDRKVFMNSSEALNYGFIDKIIAPSKNNSKKNLNEAKKATIVADNAS